MSSSPFKDKVLQYIHSCPQAGHIGFLKTYQRANVEFHWRGMKKNVKKLVRECVVCKENKSKTTLPARLLQQPLPIPQGAGVDIAMDFVENLPKSNSFDVIVVVIDRFTKYGHFLLLSHPYNAKEVAKVFFARVFKLHEMLRTIISNKDKVFLSSFWQSLFQLQGSSLHYSSSYHLQTDGQTEALNKCVEGWVFALLCRR